MTRVGEMFIYDTDEITVVATATPAKMSFAQEVLSADPDSPDGRSEWLWIRLATGELILGVFPQGKTYDEYEEFYE